MTHNVPEGARFKPGEPIAWTYIHATSAKTRFRRYKYGTFIRYGKKLCVVALDGNTTYSRVKEADLQSRFVEVS